MKRAFTSPEELEKLVDEYFSKCSATEEQLHLKNGDVRIRRTLPSVAKLGQSGESYTAVGIAIAGGVKGLQLDAVAHTCEDSRVTLYISTTITIITLSSIYVIFALSVQ